MREQREGASRKKISEQIIEEPGLDSEDILYLLEWRPKPQRDVLIQVLKKKNFAEDTSPVPDPELPVPGRE